MQFLLYSFLYLYCIFVIKIRIYIKGERTMKFSHLMPLAAFLCISLFFSCSSDLEMPPPPEQLENPISSSAQVWSYCVYPEIQVCYPDSYSVCPGSGGELRDDCPYGSSNPVQSSSAGELAGNSSSSQAEQGNSSSNSSSSEGGVAQEYDYCVFAAERNCLLGPLTICPPGGELSNACPYNSSSSSLGTTTSSSSLGTTTSSSSLGTTISSSSQGGSLTNTNIFTDPRDGKKYKFEVAPDGKIWMSENLNFSNNNTLGYCYNVDINGANPHIESATCGSGYGRVYEWATAINGNPPQGLCPDGWHIPSTAEWNTINSITSMSSDFYIRPGNYDPTKKVWKARDLHGFYWASSTKNNYFGFWGSESNMSLTGVGAGDTPAKDDDKFSVRCVADAGFNLVCGGATYNPAEKFCSGTTLYTLCGNKSYEPATQRCSGNVVETQCGSDYYNAATQFCYGNQKYSKCGGATYNPTEKFCSGTTLYTLCGGITYNPSTQECSGTTLFSRCGGTNGTLYNPSIKFCYNNSTYDLCGGNDYNPTKEECISSVVTPKSGDCEGTSYLLTEKFCYNGITYNFCGGKEYNPTKQKCEGGTLDYIITNQIICNGGIGTANCNKKSVTLEKDDCVGISILNWQDQYDTGFRVVMRCEQRGGSQSTPSYTLSFNGKNKTVSGYGNEPFELGQVKKDDNDFGTLCLTAISNATSVICNGPDR
jgi:uncharacterized protein (TIGR02145 family)